MTTTSKRLLHQGRQKYYNLWLILWIVAACLIVAGAQDDDYDNVVREVLEEDEEHYAGQQNDYGGNDDDDDETMIMDAEEEATSAENKEHEEEMKRKAEEERLARERALRVRREREAAFQAELDKMSQEQQRSARKQKRRDAAVVRRVLAAAKRENHYGVLGLWNFFRFFEIRIPPRSIPLIPRRGRRFSLRIPGLSWNPIPAKTIKRAYRNRALAVHPDKNRDGRAEEAFIAVEEAASILSDPDLRLAYDEKVREHRRKVRSERIQTVLDAADGTFRATSRVLAVVRKVIGPFAVPLSILGALII